MQTTVKVQNIRMAPRKLRLVADFVRKMKVEEALQKLRWLNKIGSPIVQKAIRSAIANAEHNFELDKNNLFIQAIKVNEAAALKRWMPRAHGRATPLLKRGSHLEITLAEIKDSGMKAGKKPKAEAPVKLTEVAKEATEKQTKPETKPKDIFDAEAKDTSKEEVKEITNVQREGRAGHSRLEGGKKGFSSKMFRRKSG
ncbi:MAG: 50S ribosomal protein L22 [Patescibacteria group bacterium]